MKASASTRLVVAMLLVAGLAVAFWMLLLGPKKDEAKKLGTQVTQLEETLAAHRAEVSTAVEAREQFPTNYQQLVVLGKAVPGDDDTPSLLVQLNRIARRTHVDFLDIKLSGEGGGETSSAEAAPAASTTTSLVPPTEVAASTMPLGATIGPAGLGVMPYELTFTGSFFKLADFIKELDALVKTENEKTKKEELDVNGRLLTINGFSLEGFPTMTAEFSLTSYLTPPEQGVTAGATPTGPATSEVTPASTTTGGTP